MEIREKLQCLKLQLGELLEFQDPFRTNQVYLLVRNLKVGPFAGVVSQLNAVHLAIYAFGYIFEYSSNGIEIRKTSTGQIEKGDFKYLIYLDDTSKTTRELTNHIRTIAADFLPGKYDAIAHNCMKFAQNIAQFLVNQVLPHDYTKLNKISFENGQSKREYAMELMKEISQFKERIC